MLSAAAGSDRCCDFCPRSHVIECLARHTDEERAGARRHAASCRAARSTRSSASEQPGSSATGDETKRRETDTEMAETAAVAAESIDGSRARPHGGLGGEAGVRLAPVESRAPPHAPPSEERLEEGASVRARRRLRQSMKRSSEIEAAEAHDKAYLHRGAKRMPRGDDSPNFAAEASRAPMPATSQ